MIQDKIAENQLLGALYTSPELFDNQKIEQLKPVDFTSPLRQLIFKVLENMYDSGFQNFSIGKVETYLSKFPNSFEQYTKKTEDGNFIGRKYLEKLDETGTKDNFDYSFDKVKKFTLLRNLKDSGLDITQYYNENETNPDYIEKQNKWLEKNNLQQISNIILSDVESAISDTVSTFNESYDASYNIEKVVNDLQKVPDYGAPMPIPILNEALRGMRLGTFYIYSAGTGMGKSRTLISFAATRAIGMQYDWTNKEWHKICEPEKVVYIGTELQLEELQAILVSFVSGISQDKIMKNKLDYEEKQILQEAIKYIEKGKLKLEIVPEYTLGQLERIIKQNSREGCNYFFFDYIVATIELMEELKNRAGMNLREDQILHMVSTSLKNMCTLYNVFIFSATQLTSDAYDGELGVQSVRGSRAIVDRADALLIGSRIRPVDKKNVEKIVSEGQFYMPNYQLKIVKSRGTEQAGYTYFGQYDLGNMTYKNCFTLDSIGNVIETRETEIREKGAF